MQVIGNLINKKNEKALIGTLPYIEIGDIDVESKDYIYKNKGSVSGAIFVQKNDILVSKVRPTRGAITIVKDEIASASNAFVKLRVNPEINYKYLYYNLNRKIFFEYLGTKETGVTYPSCTADDIYNYEIKVPLLEEQLEIVEFLDNVNEAINNRNLQIKDLNKMIDSKYNEIISNEKFDLVEIDHLVKKISKIKISDRDINYIDISSIDRNRNKITDYKQYNLMKAPSRAKQLLEENDILYSSVRPNLRNIAMFKFSKDEEFVGSTGFIVLRANNKVTPQFLYHTILRTDFTEKMVEKTNGATYPAINRVDLVNEKIHLVDKTIQEQFDIFCNNIDLQIELIEQEIIDLESLLYTKMHEYFD